MLNVIFCSLPALFALGFAVAADVLAPVVALLVPPVAEEVERASPPSLKDVLLVLLLAIAPLLELLSALLGPVIAVVGPTRTLLSIGPLTAPETLPLLAAELLLLVVSWAAAGVTPAARRAAIAAPVTRVRMVIWVWSLLRKRGGGRVTPAPPVAGAYVQGISPASQAAAARTAKSRPP